MSVIASIQKSLVPVRREGLPFIAAFAVVSVLLGWLWQPLFWIGLILTGWCILFFRDPPRVSPLDPNLVLSPADGVVSFVGLATAPPELQLEGQRVRISVFMSVFNCHVNRAVCEGTVGAVAYRPGKFFNASLDKASEENERNAIRLDLADGRRIAVVQIAGLVARRIVCFVQPGTWLRTGERFGLIRFGSRLDIYLPPGVEPLVTLGQTMVAGETVLADLAGGAPAMAARRD